MQKIKSFLNFLFETQELLQKYYIIKKDVLTFEEALIYLNVSDSFLYKKTAACTIPYYKPEGKIYFRRQELDQWILQSPIKTKEDIEQEAENYLALNRKRGNR